MTRHLNLLNLFILIILDEPRLELDTSKMNILTSAEELKGSYLFPFFLIQPLI